MPIFASRAVTQFFVFQGTLTKHKNELLFSEFGINYGKLPEMYKKVRPSLEGVVGIKINLTTVG